jgi:hypothetical protein
MKTKVNKAQAAQAAEERRKKLEQERRKEEIAHLAYLLQYHSEDGWTLAMSPKTKAEVLEYIKQEKEREQEEQDDYSDDGDYCRNCGCHGTFFEGCCSVRCAKDADEYD